MGKASASVKKAATSVSLRRRRTWGNSVSKAAKGSNKDEDLEDELNMEWAAKKVSKAAVAAAKKASSAAAAKKVSASVKKAMATATAAAKKASRAAAAKKASASVKKAATSVSLRRR